MDVQSKVLHYFSYIHGGCSTFAEVDAFRKHLKGSFGSLGNAWKMCMDLNKDGQISYQEFANTCRVRRDVGSKSQSSYEISQLRIRMRR